MLNESTQLLIENACIDIGMRMPTQAIKKSISFRRRTMLRRDNLLQARIQYTDSIEEPFSLAAYLDKELELTADLKTYFRSRVRFTWIEIIGH